MSVYRALVVLFEEYVAYFAAGLDLILTTAAVLFSLAGAIIRSVPAVSFIFILIASFQS